MVLGNAGGVGDVVGMFLSVGDLGVVVSGAACLGVVVSVPVTLPPCLPLSFLPSRSSSFALSLCADGVGNGVWGWGNGME